MEDKEDNPPIRLLTRNDLVKLGLSFSNTQLISLEGAGLFPKRLRVSVQRVAWVEQEITDFIQQKISERS